MDALAIGKFIAEARKAKGLTQTELADKIGVTDKAVSRWERGRGFPDISLLEPLAGALDVSILELMHAQRQGTASLTEADAAELMRCAEQITKENQVQEKTAQWISAFVTLAVGALVVVLGIGNLWGGLFVGALASVAVVALYYYVRNRESPSSRRIYGAFLLAGVSFLRYLLAILGVGPEGIILMLYGILAVVLLWGNN